MPEIKERLQKAGINIIMSYIEKDPEKNLEKLLDGFDLFQTDPLRFRESISGNS